MSKRALITGIAGQDGSYLAEILLERGVQVHGLHRRTSTGNLSRIAHILDKVTLHRGDLADPQSMEAAIVAAKPDIIFNCADQDNVDWSLATPAYSADITAGAVMRTLESVRRIDKGIRFFQPVSATIFGDAPPPQNEATPLNPLSPYAVCKAAAYHAARYYRQAHGMFVSTAILFNHDSPRRGGEYLLHKIVKGALAIKKGEAKTLALGCLDMQVDIGFAQEYMRAVCTIMQMDEPVDYVIGTGKACSIGCLVEAAGLGRSQVITDAQFVRPGKQPSLVADIARLRRATGFNPWHNAETMVGMLMGHYSRGRA